MKLSLSLLLYILTTIVLHAQSEQIVTHYTIEVAVGEQYVWTPTQVATIDNVSDLHYHTWTKDLMPTPMSSWEIYWGD